MSSDNRKKLFIDKFVQGTLVRQLIIHWISFVIATSLALALFTWISNPLVTRDELLAHLGRRLLPIVIAAICIVPLFVRDAISFSHRMVGPITRLRRELKSLADGNTANKIEFRPDDYWQDVAGEFNEFSDCVTRNAAAH